MKSIMAPPASIPPVVSSSAARVALVIGGSLAVAWLTLRFSGPVLGAGLLGLMFCTVFLARPDIGLLVALFVRSATELVFHYVQVGEGLRLMLLSPNSSLILILIFAGGLYVVTRHVRVLSLPGGTILVLLLFTGLVGMLRSVDALYSFREWLPVVSLVVVYALTAYFFRTPQQMQRVVDVIGASFIIPAIWGFDQLIGHSGFALGGFNRIYGSFIHPNPFAFYLAMIIMLFIGQSFVTTGLRRRLSLVIVVAAGTLLVGTLTRMAWVGTIAGLLAIGAFRSWKLLFLVPLTTVLIAVAFPHTVERVGNPVDDPTTTGLEDRFETWGSTYRYWVAETHVTDEPVVTLMNRLGGLGPGAVSYLTEKREGESYAAHNDYIRVLIEYGIFGLTLYILLLLTMLFFGYRTFRASAGSPLAAIPLSFFALTLAYMLMSFTDNVFASTQNQVYYWALAGMTAAIGQTSFARAPRKAGHRSWTPVRGAPAAVPKGARA